MDGGDKAEPESALFLPCPGGNSNGFHIVLLGRPCASTHFVSPALTSLASLAGVTYACFHQKSDSSLRTREKHSLREATAGVLHPWARVSPNICMEDRVEHGAEKGKAGHASQTQVGLPPGGACPPALAGNGSGTVRQIGCPPHSVCEGRWRGNMWPPPVAAL